MKKLILIILLLCATAGFGQWNIWNNSSYNIWKVNQTSYKWDTDALAYFAKMTVPPTNSVMLAIDTFIKTLKSTYCTKLLDTTSYSDTTLWQRKDVINIFGIQDSASALLDLKGYRNALNVNNCTFEAYVGFSGDYPNTKYIKSTYMPSADKISLSQNSASISFYVLDYFGFYGYSMNTGAQDITGNNLCMTSYNTNILTYYVNDVYNQYDKDTASMNGHYFSANRITATNKNLYTDGYTKYTQTRNSRGIPDNLYAYITTQNIYGSAQGWNVSPYFEWDIGGGMTSVDQRNFFNALEILRLSIQSPLKNKVVCFGNSLTAYNPGFPSQLQTLLGNQYKVLNYGQGGVTFEGMLKNYDGSIAGLRTTVLYDKTFLTVWEGTNSLTKTPKCWANSEDTSASAYDQCRRICLKGKASGFKVIVMTTLPYMGGDSVNNLSRDSLNTLLKANWNSFADTIVDVCADTNIGTFNKCDPLYYIDCTHMTQLGYGIVANMVYTAIINYMKRYAN